MKHILTVVLLCILLSSCLGGNGSVSRPSISASKAQIQVGESITITISLRGQPLQSSPGYDPIEKAFIYSPNPLEEVGYPAPYAPMPNGGFDPKTDPSLFPIAPILEITTPTTPSSNVPPLVDIISENSQIKGVFVIKAKAIGSAKIKGGFLLTTLQYPNNYGRTPIIPSFDGEIIIQVVP
jgi:hypothetical protein